jgi:hypothetical protein
MDRPCNHTDEWKWRMLVNNEQNWSRVSLPYIPKSGHQSHLLSRVKVAELFATKCYI